MTQKMFLKRDVRQKKTEITTYTICSAIDIMNNNNFNTFLTGQHF